MAEQNELCEQCKNELTGDFCSNCGRPKQLKRIDGKYIISEISSVLNFDKGILFTIKELLLRPGQSVHHFIHKDRNRLVKPVIFIIISSLVYTIAQQLFRFEDGYVSSGGFGESAVTIILSWIQQNYGYANILMAIMIALWIKIFFRKYNYNIFEILILLCFVIGIGMLMYTAFGITESLSNLKLLHFGGFIGLVYASWAIGQFFDKNIKLNYLKGLLSYLFGMTSFFLTAIIVGVLIDMIIK